MDLHFSYPHIVRHWASTWDQHRQTNRLYRRTRIGVSQREHFCNKEERFLTPGYACVPCADWLSVAATTQYFLSEPTLRTRETMGFGGLEKSARALPRTKYTWSAFWTTRDRLNFLFTRRATRLRREPYEVPGDCKFTSTVCFLGESNST